MNMRKAIIAALRKDPDLLPKELAEKRLKKIEFRDRRTIKIRGLTTPVVAYSV